MDGVVAEGRRGGVAIDVDYFAPPPPTAPSPLRPRAPLNGRKGHSGTRDPCSPACGQNLRVSYRSTAPQRVASVSLQPF